MSKARSDVTTQVIQDISFLHTQNLRRKALMKIRKSERKLLRS